VPSQVTLPPQDLTSRRMNRVAPTPAATARFDSEELLSLLRQGPEKEVGLRNTTSADP
jgi:hypothetical protein